MGHGTKRAFQTKKDTDSAKVFRLCPLLISYQFGIAPVVQYKVLWFEVSVDDAFGMQVGKGLHHTSRVKPGG